MDCPTPSERPIENNGEIRRLSNRFCDGENAPLDVPTIARRVDQNGNWNRARWGWLKAVTGDGELSPMARLLAHVLATQFSHHETAHCTPGTETLADALCTSVDTIKRALRDLAAAGWLIRTEGRGRGNRSEIFFLGGNNVVPMICPKGPETSGHARPKPAQAPSKGHEKGGKSAPFYNRNTAAKKGADMRGKGGKSALSYIKDDPKNIQRAGQQSETSISPRSSGRMDWTNYDRATEPEKWERGLCDIKRGTYAEDAWNAWLADHGFPTLVQIGLGNGPDGWAVPFRMPPRVDDDKIEISLSLKWARIFSRNAKERANV
ncbi:helix-turn-helix domain-containing protein [Loktanella fryxellensis]|uniref:helix-turn-helix domain-containing protein n=1 Tax=Loktanella fryxellensis TaxID=245187 RepID=UPI0015A6E647|nr:helix-turn-helix domain-containing protein [Loktanella fryxellensis]